jgi:hypothetical protein
MKTLPEVLRDAMILLDDSARAYVVIERGHHEPLDGRSSTFQIRLGHDLDMGLSEYRCEARSWLGEQWSNWRAHRGWLGGGGFDTSDVLATDWRITS